MTIYGRLDKNLSSKTSRSHRSFINFQTTEILAFQLLSFLGGRTSKPVAIMANLLKWNQWLSLLAEFDPLMVVSHSTGKLELQHLSCRHALILTSQQAHRL